MKIVFLSKYSGKVTRGAETYVSELSRSLEKLGYKTAVYNFINPFGQLPRDSDVVIPVNGRWQALLTRLWCWIFNKKMLISGQSGLGIDDRWNLFCFPNRFIALTNAQRKWAKKANPFANIEVVPNGVNLKKFNSKVAPLATDLPKPLILAVGALVPEKRHELVIQAVTRLKEASLLIVGDGPEKEKLQNLGDQLLPGRFKITHVPHNHMPQVYKAADVFTFPTVPWESFGIVLVEAMASGLSVVTSDDPIRREIVGDAGLFIDPENSDDFAKALQSALQIKWGNTPRQQAEKFSWDQIAQKYAKIFEELYD